MGLEIALLRWRLRTDCTKTEWRQWARESGSVSLFVVELEVELGDENRNRSIGFACWRWSCPANLLKQSWLIWEDLWLRAFSKALVAVMACSTSEAHDKHHLLAHRAGSLLKGLLYHGILLVFWQQFHDVAFNGYRRRKSGCLINNPLNSIKATSQARARLELELLRFSIW